jgi:transcriptional regulator with XRE-family HTH domain
MEENNLSLAIELPVTDTKKEKPRINCLVEMLAEIMSERKLTDAQIVKATGIPFSTWDGWTKGKVNTQLADKNLLKLAQYLNVSLFYLLYGIGDDSPVFDKFDEFEKFLEIDN